jgi:hypothetical protein
VARNQGIYFKYKGSANQAVEKWTKDIEKQLKDYKGDLKRKLEKVLDVVEEVSQRLVPERTGATKQSFYREVVEEDGKIIARAGYDRDGHLEYVVYIHEFDPEPNWTKTGAENRFLAKGFESASYQIDRILEED